MKIQTVGGFLQCFKQPISTIETVTSFRKAYPNGSLVIISDGGYDYSGLAEEVGAVYRKEPRIGSDIGIVSSNRNLVEAWLKRLIEAASIMKEEYIMILEDDVRIFDSVTDLKYDLNGINNEVGLGKGMTAFLKSCSAKIPQRCSDYYYGGCGGSLIRRSFLIEKLKDITSAIDTLEYYLDAQFKNNYVSDYWLSVLFLYFGGTIGPYFGFSETNYISYPFRRFFLKNIETLHWDKSLHNVPFRPGDLEILGWDKNNPDRQEYEQQVLKSLKQIGMRQPRGIRSLRGRFFKRISQKINGLRRSYLCR